MPDRMPDDRPKVMRRPRGTGRVVAVRRKGGWAFRSFYPGGAAGTVVNAGTYDDEEAAHRALDVLHNAAAEGLAPAAGMTVGAWCERWIAAREAAGHHANARSERGYLRPVLEGSLAALPLDVLTAREVRAWVADELPRVTRRRAVRKGGKTVSRDTGKPISHQTAVHALGCLRRALEAAVVDGRLEANPAAGVTVPKPIATRTAELEREVDYLDAAEIEAVLGHAKMPPATRAALAVAIYAGLRQGEIAGLQWRDFDWERARVWVRRSWDGAPTKNRQRRQVAVIPPLLAHLQAYRAQLGARAQRPSAWVFPGRDGGQLARGYDWAWATRKIGKGKRAVGWRERCGIRDGIRFHDLRDTCATHLLSGTWAPDGAVWPIALVSRQLGHSSTKVTEERYAHLLPSALDAAAARLRGGPGDGGGEEGLGAGAGTPAGGEPRHLSGEQSGGDPSSANPAISLAAGRLPKPKVAGSNPAGGATTIPGASGPNLEAETGGAGSLPDPSLSPADWIAALQAVAQGRPVDVQSLAFETARRAHEIATLALALAQEPGSSFRLRRLAEALTAAGWPLAGPAARESEEA